MLKKLFKSDRQKIISSFISALIFVYILLFEFILPANKFLPKPTILLDSIHSLYLDYNFTSAFLFTFSAIYFVMLVSFILIRIAGSIGFKIVQLFPGLIVLFDIGKYFIPLFLVLLFELWFGNSAIGEYLFILIIIMGLLKSRLFNSFLSIKEEYLLSARSLGVSEKVIINKVIWKSLEPKLFDEISKNHISIWGVVLIYEFVCKTSGIGNTIYNALKYNDLSVIIIVILFLFATFFIMEYFLTRIKKKYFFWE